MRRLTGVLLSAFLVLAGPTHSAEKIPKVGLLSATSPDRATGLESFRQGLRDLGYVEGGTIALEYQWAHGRLERLNELAAELVRLKVDVIVAPTTPAALAAKQATSTIPIVLVTSGDPIGSRLVTNLARPGGNITGLTLAPTLEITGKQLGLLKEAFPTLTEVAVLANPTNPPTAGFLQQTELAAQSLRVRLRVVHVKAQHDLNGAFAVIKRERLPALLVIPDPLVNNARAQIVSFAAANRLPAIYPYRSFVDAGGLMSYGVDLSDLHRRAAGYVDKILRGAKPADLPIEQPEKFDLVINLKTAKALGLTIASPLLLRADSVLQ